MAKDKGKKKSQGPADIHIKASHEGRFTAFAHGMGMGIQEAASHVLANKDDYSESRERQAQFARNATHFNRPG